MTTENFNCGSLDLLYAVEDYERVADYFKVQRLLMAIIGQQPHKLQAMLPKCMQGFIGASLTWLYSCFVIANSLIFSLLYAKTTFDNVASGDLGGMSDALTNGLIYTASCFSTTYFLWYMQPLSDYMTNVNREYRHHSLAGLTFVSYYAPYPKVQSLVVVWVLLCFFGAAAWVLAPILRATHSLPLKCWYPFDVMVSEIGEKQKLNVEQIEEFIANSQAPGVYEINFFMQVFGQINVALTISTFSGVFILFVALFLSQFDVLYCSLKNLNFHAQLLCGEDLKSLEAIQSKIPFRQTDELNQYMLLEEHKTDLKVYAAFYAKRQQTVKSFTPQAALHESLRECVLLHRFLLKACLELESFYHPSNFLITMQCTIQLCLLVFAAVVGEHSPMHTFNAMQYFCLTLANLFFYTYSAELLRQHSVRSGEAFWRSQWTPFNVQAIRRDIMIFLINSNHVVQLTAGKFYTMDINHLRKSLVQVFSLFTLLRSFAKRGNI